MGSGFFAKMTEESSLEFVRLGEWGVCAFGNAFRTKIYGCIFKDITGIDLECVPFGNMYCPYEESECRPINWSDCVVKLDKYIADNGEKTTVTASCGVTHPMKEIVGLRNFFDICARHGLEAKCIG